MKTIVFDHKKCIGCHNCQLACKDEHVGNPWLPIAQAQPEGHFWLKMIEVERGVIPRVRVERNVVMCQHCAEAPCMAAAADGAIYRRDDGIVIIDPEKSGGQRAIMEACPYGAVFWNEALDIPQKCTMCAHLLDEGWKEPRCVTACPNEALVFVDEREVEKLGSLAEPLDPQFGTKPTVVHVNIPRPYGTGEVYDPVANRCLGEVEVAFENVESGEVRKAMTNNYGDFTVEGLVPGPYRVSFKKEPYYPKTIEFDVDYVADLGEVKLYRA